MDLFQNQHQDFNSYKIVAGVDEAGRGPIAGPVVVASVILKKKYFSKILDDSKKISEKKRNILYNEIIENCEAYSIIEISPQIIDEKNILQATLWGMDKAIEGLQIIPEIALIDGNKIPIKYGLISKAIIKGDGKYASIAAASILAKVHRDKLMLELHKKFPIYNFAKHKGYPTKEHLDLIKKYGVNEHYRFSYKPVRLIAEQSGIRK